VVYVRMIEPWHRGFPKRIGEFRIIGRLGRGGFGTVFVGWHEGTGELAAVKVLQSELARDPDFRARFGKETRAIAQAFSPYVPQLKDHGVDGETLWLATELVRGPSLAQVIPRSGALPERTVWQLALGIAAALREIHGAGLLHRDLKPGNVLLVPDGPRIIDFGLAHLTEADHQTASGLPMCSPEYAPPEQRRSLREALEYADVFTFGGTLLFAATGHPPFGAARTPLPGPPNLAGLPDSLYDVVAQCLCQDELARPRVPELIAYFEGLAGVEAAGGDRAFASVLTDWAVQVIEAWQRELDDVIRLARTGQPEVGDRPGPGHPARLRETAPQLTAALTDAHAPTYMFTGHRDHGTMTIPAAAPVRARPVEGDGFKLQWTIRLGDWIRAPVAVTSGMAVAATLGGVVAGFALRNGNVLGQAANLGVPVRSAVLPPGATPADWAYVGGADGVMYGVDLTSGRHWPVLYSAGAIEGPPVPVGGFVYALSADGCVHEIDAYMVSEPEVVCRLDGPVLGTLSAADGVLIVASAEGWVYAIDPDDRAVRRLCQPGGPVFGAPATVGGRVHIAGSDGRLWSVRVDGGEPAVLDIGVPVHASVVHDRGLLYVGGSDGMVRAYGIAGTGEPVPLWLSEEIGGEVSGVAVCDGTVVAAAGRTLTALDGTTGERRARFLAKTLITAAPVMKDGLIYIASLDGAVSCLAMTSSPARAA
jgi:outer membrane protein assembly factor BamB